MTEEESKGYEKQIEDLKSRLDERNSKISFYKKRLDELKICGNYKEIDSCIAELDKLLMECKMDQELREDILNMLEVEHFLECGNGRTFDVEYDN